MQKKWMKKGENFLVQQMKNDKFKFIPIKWIILNFCCGKWTPFYSCCSLCFSWFSFFPLFIAVATKRCNNPISTKATDQYTCFTRQWTSIHNTRKLCPSPGGSYDFHFFIAFESMQLCSNFFHSITGIISLFLNLDKFQTILFLFCSFIRYRKIYI